MEWTQKQSLLLTIHISFSQWIAYLVTAFRIMPVKASCSQYNSQKNAIQKTILALQLHYVLPCQVHSFLFRIQLFQGSQNFQDYFYCLLCFQSFLICQLRTLLYIT